MSVTTPVPMPKPATYNRRQLLGRAALFAAAGAYGMPSVACAQNAPQVGAAWPNVTALIERYVSEGKVANVVAMLGTGRDGARSIARGTLAIDSDVPATADSLYRIYSMTKPITGMAAMMLIDAGKMGLDQPLADILPAYKDMQVQIEYDGSIAASNLEPAKRPITMRHLLTHTSGLGYTITQKGPIKTAYEEAGLVPGLATKLPGLKDIFNPATPAPNLAVFAERLAEMPLVAQPGTRWLYSLSLDLMGRVIEVVSGQEFATFLREHIFTPTGMNSTTFEVPYSERDRLTTNYTMNEGKLVTLDPPQLSIYTDQPPFPFGGAGLVSTPADYDRFLAMLGGYGKIGGKRVMSERAVRIGTSDLMPTGAKTEGTFVEGQGFGAGGRVGRGAMAGNYGWAGAAGTVGNVHMPSGLRSSMFSQYMPAELYPLQREFGSAVAKDIAASLGT